MIRHLVPALMALALLPTLALAQSTGPATQPDRPAVIVAIGAEGAPQFAPDFAAEADHWIHAATLAHAQLTVIGRESLNPATQLAGNASASQPVSTPATQPATQPTDKDRLHHALDAAALDPVNPLYLVFIGHGTFDGKDAKLNLTGPDVSDSELAGWLAPLQRPVALIDTTASSAPFLTRISGKNRVIITATRAGSEINYTRFGQYFAQAIDTPGPNSPFDLDKDGQTSLLEAFLAASHKVDEFYKQQGRLVTEHALLDDNGDRLGTSADFFDGVRPAARAASNAAIDGARAHQWHLLRSPEEQAMPPAARAKRDALELQLDALRLQKSTMSADDYYAKLDALLLQLAHLYADSPTPDTQPATLPTAPTATIEIPPN
ncbi:MAG TPA: hypothetical protein VHQ47_11750 [Phycisphaerae bacterium]|nr:hypothetical protein [Phycisphaerae bacterium]